MPLQREFKGLADHTGLYMAGRLPFELQGAVQPQFSVEDFMSPPELITWSGTGNSQNVVVSAPVVPDSQIHRVRWIGASYTTAAGLQCLIAPVVFYVSEHYGLTPFNAQVAVPTATTINKSGVHFPGEGLLLYPGQSVGWQIQYFAGAGNCTIFGIYQHQVIGI